MKTGTFIRFGKLADLIYPAKCVSCGELLGDGEEVFCSTCFDSYENAKQEICSRCFAPRCRCTCPSLSLGRLGIRRIIKLYKYRPSEGDLPENRILFALKQQHLERVFSFLASELADAINAALKPSEKSNLILVPCPRSRAAKGKFGYDHMEVLAKKTADLIGAQYHAAIRRSGGGKMQKKLSRYERKQNVKTRFSIPEPIPIVGKNVLLLDDVTTSGATLSACRRLLLDNGAHRVIPCVIAMTGRDFVIRPQKGRKKGKKYKKKTPAVV